MTTNVVETESTTAVVTENDLTSVVEVTSAGPAGPPGGSLTIQDEGVDEGLLTDKINFAGSTVSVVNDTEAEIATVTVNAADPGANTNITSLGGITGGISSPDYVQFDTAAAAAGAVGRLLWNDTDGTLEFQLKGGNVTLQIGQEQVIRVTNTAGVTMTDGQAVYITGSTGNHLNVTLAQANAEATSSKTLAVVTETIANNSTGFATSSGLVRGLDTSALTEGAAIWLSPTVPGGLTTTRPTAPDHAVLIGWCVRQHASVGVIYVHIANGYELEELHDVLITAAANNQVLRYDAATGLWKNATISPTLTLTGDVSGSATFTDLGNATLTATVADDSHNHIISNVDGLQDALDSKLPAASYTAADVLVKLKTVDGAGSGLDADLLDGQSGAYYLDFTNTTNKPDPTITLDGDVSGSVTLTDLGSGTLTATVADNSHAHTIENVTGLQAALNSKLLATDYNAADVLTKIKTVDGTGSGLDADLLDGQEGAHYLDFTNATNKPDPTITLAGDATGSVTLTDLISGTLNVTVVDDSHNHVIANVDGLQDALDSKLPSASYTATDVLDKIKTVDGAGSGLDADMLDGQSSAYYTAINDRLGYTAENAANKGIAGGYASLDGAGLVPATQLPSYVDDVLEFANLAAFPVTGETGKIYVAVDTAKTYRWSGTTYVEISASPGSTDAVPEGSSNLYFTTARARQSISAAGSLTYDNSTGVMSFTDAVTSVAGRTGDITLSTSDVSEGTNLYFTNARARSAIGVSGSLAYDSATGVVSYTTPNTDGIAEGTANLYHTTARARGAVSAGTGISYDSGTGVITNAAPDQTVAITGSGTTTVTGTYPNFTVSSADQYVGTVTSVSGTGTVNGLTLTGTVTSSGSLTLGGTLSVDLSTATVTGTLPVSKGGTGATSLTSGYLVKGNGTSAVGASVVYDNGTNVGIGTTTPGNKLEANGNIAASTGTGLVALKPDGVDGNAIRWGGTGASAGIFKFLGPAETERMRIDGNGDVGIGVTDPTSKLHVKNGSNAIEVYPTGTWAAQVYNANDNPGSNGLVVGNRWATSTSTAFEVGSLYGGGGGPWASYMKVDGAGNVGIGTSSPGSLLHLGTATPEIRFDDTDVLGVVQMRQSGAAFLITVDPIGVDAGSNFQIAVDGAEAMRITSAGNVGIGTSSPGAKLDVVGNVIIGAALTTGTGASTGDVRVELGANRTGDGPCYIDWHSTAGADFECRVLRNSGANGTMDIQNTGTGGINLSNLGSAPITLNTAGAERMRIDSSGNVGIGTSSPSALLDVNADTVRVRTAKTPASATAAGNAGDICWDSNYVYVCVATNTWKRSALSTW